MSSPALIEPEIKRALTSTLAKCHQFKLAYFERIFNIAAAILLLIIITGVLYCKYKGKPTPEELNAREQKKRAFISSKLQEYKTSQIMTEQYLITGLPHYTQADVM